MLWDAQTSSFPLHMEDHPPQDGRVGAGAELTVNPWPWDGQEVVSIVWGMGWRVSMQGITVEHRSDAGAPWGHLAVGLSAPTQPLAPVSSAPSPCQELISHPWPLSLSTAEVLASQTPYRQPDLRGQDWAGETPASSRSPPATSPPPGWGCWAPVGCWAPPSAAPPPAPPSSSKADRLVGVHGISSFSIPSPQASFAFSSLTCPDLPFFPPTFQASQSGLQACGLHAPPCSGMRKRDRREGGKPRGGGGRGEPEGVINTWH